jgi:hypothetical protein
VNDLTEAGAVVHYDERVESDALDSDRVRLVAMTTTQKLKPAYDALDGCDAALSELESLCCRPERSPRMAALADTLAKTRSGLDAAIEDHHSADEALALIEDAGAQIGWLQVGCCAPARLPLYHTLLEGLTVTQRSLKRATGGGH